MTGTALAVVDVDPRNGGDVHAVAALLAALGVRTFAEVDTPGGGRHFYVAGTADLPTCHDLTGYRGVDVQSHGAHVFLPGTQRPKYDGNGYTVRHDDLAAVSDGGDPDGAAALAAWVLSNRRTTARAEPYPVAVPWGTGIPDRRQAAYLETVVASQGRQLAAMPPDSGRNTALFTAALKAGSLVTGAGLDEGAVVARLLEASRANGLVGDDGSRAVEETVRSGLTKGKANPRAVPPARDVPLSVLPEVTATGADVNAVGAGELEIPDGHIRRVVLTAASRIQPRRVRWLWEGRLAVGTLGLLAGREGLGKSTLAYWLAAEVTRGRLPGEEHGHPRGVLVCASEDSWAHTIIPRLIAAGADLDRVFRVEVLTYDDLHVELSLPRDLAETERAATENDVSLLLLDPLMSRLGADLDTHKDGDVRRALEPLVALADRADLSVLGLIHHNKSGTTDPMQLVMGSRAFTAVARSVHTVIPDPDDESEQRRLFGTPKNNLGRGDLPTLAFVIEGHAVPTDDGDAWTGRIEWRGEGAASIAETMRQAGGSEEDRSASTEAADWLRDYLQSAGGTAPSADIKAAGHRAGHSFSALRRGRLRLKVWTKAEGFPRVTYWGDPDLVDRDVTDEQGAR